MVDKESARNVDWHILISSLLKVMNDATHNEDEYRITWYMFPWIPPNFYLRDSLIHRV